MQRRIMAASDAFPATTRQAEPLFRSGWANKSAFRDNTVNVF
jgi:hypothetical protein